MFPRCAAVKSQNRALLPGIVTVSTMPRNTAIPQSTCRADQSTTRNAQADSPYNAMMMVPASQEREFLVHHNSLQASNMFRCEHCFLQIPYMTTGFKRNAQGLIELHNHGLTTQRNNDIFKGIIWGQRACAGSLFVVPRYGNGRRKAARSPDRHKGARRHPDAIAERLRQVGFNARYMFRKS